jgi:hypothetical protein
VSASKTVRLRLLLIVVNVLCWLGGASAVMALAEGGRLGWKDGLNLGILVTVSIVCATYLYWKVEGHRVEWTLFGLLGNVNALLVYWIVNYVRPRWRRGESVLGTPKPVFPEQNDQTSSRLRPSRRRGPRQPRSRA